MRDDVSLCFSAAFVLLLCIVRITRERFQRSFGLRDIIATLSGEGPKVETCNAIFLNKKNVNMQVGLGRICNLCGFARHVRYCVCVWSVFSWRLMSSTEDKFDHDFDAEAGYVDSDWCAFVCRVCS